MIIAMAGHVDHGKTALVLALTGIDADRLPDEKRRGMTIDLGFAHTTMANGTVIGFVDVPGHERFLGNMLAGVLSVGSVLLVVAADDGPMPQTREHLAILRLTHIGDITAVISKIDRVPAGRVDAVAAQVRDDLARAGYHGAPVFPVSSHTGDGIEALRLHIENLAAREHQDASMGGFRLAIDRGFLIPGTGLVVTGTVASGRVSIGDRLVLTPSGLAARVRGIEVHHAAAETARAGDRCALAITGPRIEKSRLRRGDWVVDPRLHAPTTRLDVMIRTVEDRGLRHAAKVHVHLGTTGVTGRALSLTSADIAPGAGQFVTIALDQAVPALHGDRIILRDDSTGRVVAGGHVADPFAPARRVRRDQRLRSLAALSMPDPKAALESLLEADGWVDLARFALAHNLPPESLASLSVGAAAARAGHPSRPILLSEATQLETAAALTARLAEWHARHPDMPGPGKAALLAGLRAIPVEAAEAVLLDQIALGTIVRQDAALRLPDHRPVLGAIDEAHWHRIEPALEAAGTKPPRVRELATELGLDPTAAEALLVRLERFGRLMRVAPNRFFPPSAVITLGELAATLDGESDGAGFNAGVFNQRSGLGRNLTIEVLEFLDRIGVTRRDGNTRYLLRPASEVLG